MQAADWVAAATAAAMAAGLGAERGTAAAKARPLVAVQIGATGYPSVVGLFTALIGPPFSLSSLQKTLQLSLRHGQGLTSINIQGHQVKEAQATGRAPHALPTHISAQ